jgi:hypothetical protein
MRNDGDATIRTVTMAIPVLDMQLEDRFMIIFFTYALLLSNDGADVYTKQ